MHKLRIVGIIGLLALINDVDSRNRTSIPEEFISGFVSHRYCWWNEICKEEFQQLFRCKCPSWQYCSSPGRYYPAKCSISQAGFVWNQPPADWQGTKKS